VNLTQKHVVYDALRRDPPSNELYLARRGVAGPDGCQAGERFIYCADDGLLGYPTF